MITLAFLSFHSRHLLEKNIKDIISFNLNLPIIIIENSQDHLLKDEFETRYKNLVKVYIPEENLGFSKGMNKAIELAETKYVFLNPSDILLPFNCLSGLMRSNVLNSHETSIAKNRMRSSSHHFHINSQNIRI